MPVQGLSVAVPVQGLSVPVLGLPIINRPDLMFRMLRSVDFPIDTLLIVHNRDQVPRSHRDPQEPRVRRQYIVMEKSCVIHFLLGALCNPLGAFCVCRVNQTRL